MTDAADLSPRARATLPRGFADRDALDLAAAAAMMAKIGEVYALYGFEAVETPLIEYTDALGKFLPDQDRPNEGVFSFKDDDEQWLSLRYDLTAPLARYVAANYEKLPKPYRSYRSGWVFRNEKPGPGRFRQFMQLDADTVGAAAPSADAEICMMAADCLEALGIKRGDYVVKLNSRKALDGVMAAIGLGGEANAWRRLTVMRAIDKLDRLGVEGVRLLLGAGRKDESGDFTKGAGLRPEDIDQTLALLTGGADPFVPDPGGARGRSAGGAGLEELAQIESLVRGAGYGPDRIRVDPSVVRGLEYYTGPVFEAELTFEIKEGDGHAVRFGSVGGGGRYDGLIARFREEPVPATGFSIGVSRLLAALRAIKSPIVASAEAPGPVVVLVLDRDAASMASYQRLVGSLRQAGIAAELYLGSGGMNAQLKYADRRRSRVAVIQGSNERNAEGGAQVTIRDLSLGAELAKTTKDRADYVDLRRRAQVLAPETELVERVREALARR